VASDMAGFGWLEGDGAGEGRVARAVRAN